MSNISMTPRVGYAFAGSHVGGIGEVIRDFGRAHSNGKAIHHKYGLPVAEELLRELRREGREDPQVASLFLAHSPRKYDLDAPKALRGSNVDLFQSKRQNGEYPAGYYMDINAADRALTETGDRSDPATNPTFLGRPLGLTGIDISIELARAGETVSSRVVKFDQFAEAMRTFAAAHPELNIPKLYTSGQELVFDLFHQFHAMTKPKKSQYQIKNGLNLNHSFNGFIDSTIPHKGFKPTSITVSIPRSDDRIVFRLRPDHDLPAWYGADKDYALMVGAALTAALADVELLQT